MGMFRSTSYEISTTKSSVSGENDDEEEDLKTKVNDCIFTALNAEISTAFLKSVDFYWGKDYKLKDPHSWSALPTDGYWWGFIKHDACGMKLRLIYHFLFENTNSVALDLIWDRPGIKSKLFPASEVNSMIDTWQSAIEKEIKAAGLILKKRC